MVAKRSAKADAARDEITYTIGELTREFAVTARTLRFYEGEGLLSPQRIGQKRLYRRRDRGRLKLILRGRRLGFTLNEIRETFVLYEQVRGEAKQLHYYLDVLEHKRAQLLQQRRDIEEALGELEQSYDHCQALLRERGEKTR
jgi:DNA-binding transcriptional MerR regulator